jgi:hypothetical protein
MDWPYDFHVLTIVQVFTFLRGSSATNFEFRPTPFNSSSFLTFLSLNFLSVPSLAI